MPLRAQWRRTRTLLMFSKEGVPLTPELCSGCRASSTLSLFLWEAGPSCAPWEPPSVHPTIKKIAASTTTHRRSSIGIRLKGWKIPWGQDYTSSELRKEPIADVVGGVDGMFRVLSPAARLRRQCRSERQP